MQPLDLNGDSIDEARVRLNCTAYKIEEENKDDGRRAHLSDFFEFSFLNPVSHPKPWFK